MARDIRVLNRTLLDVLGDQPHVGFAVFSRSGVIVLCNLAARQMYYGSDRFDPIGKSVSDLEGNEFAAEILSVIDEVCLTCEPLAMDHIRFGRRMSSIGWPIRTSAEVPAHKSDAVLAMSVLSGADEIESWGVRVVASQLASWGALEVLTSRELEVLAEIGRGPESESHCGKSGHHPQDGRNAPRENRPKIERPVEHHPGAYRLRIGLHPRACSPEAAGRTAVDGARQRNVFAQRRHLRNRCRQYAFNQTAAHHKHNRDSTFIESFSSVRKNRNRFEEVALSRPPQIRQ